MNTSTPVAKQSARQIVEMVTQLVEGRNPALADHHHRTGSAARSLARLVGCTPAEVRMIEIGARLHDVGKLAVSEHILHKPSPLDASEFEQMKLHTRLGCDLVRPMGLDTAIVEIIELHHENYDGSGYPNGLRAEAIPFGARIMRIVDSYDALVSDRPYQKSLSTHGAMCALMDNARFYDPHMLKLFAGMKGHKVAR